MRFLPAVSHGNVGLNLIIEMRVCCFFLFCFFPKKRVYGDLQTASGWVA